MYYYHYCYNVLKLPKNAIPSPNGGTDVGSYLSLFLLSLSLSLVRAHARTLTCEISLPIITLFNYLPHLPIILKPSVQLIQPSCRHRRIDCHQVIIFWRDVQGIFHPNQSSQRDSALLWDWEKLRRPLEIFHVRDGYRPLHGRCPEEDGFRTSRMVEKSAEWRRRCHFLVQSSQTLFDVYEPPRVLNFLWG